MNSLGLEEDNPQASVCAPSTLAASSACWRRPTASFEECPRDFIRLATRAEDVSFRRASSRLALMVSASVVGGFSFLAVPLHRGCSEGARAVNFRWFIVDYFLCLFYCTVAYIATFNGLFPGARWVTWSATWLFIIAFQAVAISLCWRHDALDALFAITIGAASGYEITAFILLAYAVRFLLAPRFCRALRPHDSATGSPRWEAVEAKIRNTQFPQDVDEHASWVRSLPRGQDAIVMTGMDGASTVLSTASTALPQNPQRQPKTVRRPERQLLLCCAFMLCLSACYPICNFVFEKVLQRRRTCFDAFVGLAAFSFCAFVAKTVLAIIGFLCDSGVSAANFSGYYAGHFLGSFYYYSYYRAMFEHVDGWTDFLALQITHLALEWVKHVVRATEWYYKWARRWSSRGPRCYQQAVLMLFLSRQPNVSADDWARFMAVETCLQAFIIAVSLLAYATGYTVLRFVGSARESFQPFVEHMGSEEYEKLMLQLGVQVLTEFLNIMLMEMWFRRRLGGPGALKRFPLLFTRNSFFTFVLAWCTLHGANPWIQWMPQAFCKSSASSAILGVSQ